LNIFYKIFSSDSRRNKRQSRLSAFNLTRNTKPPFAHSPNHPIHPDHNGTIMTIPNDLRSQMHQKVYIKFYFKIRIKIFCFFKIG
jgi:hypothetical protein